MPLNLRFGSERFDHASGALGRHFVIHMHAQPRSFFLSVNVNANANANTALEAGARMRNASRTVGTAFDLESKH